MKRLDIYLDESGDLSPYSKTNPFYAVCFVLADDAEACAPALRKFDFDRKKSSLPGDFVHVGPLVRNEPPYKGYEREDRQRLFYGLYLLAMHAPISLLSVEVEKRPGLDLGVSLTDALLSALEEHRSFFARYDDIVLHYDNGQPFLMGVVLGAFRAKLLKARFEKTLQSEHPFMQVADLVGEMELIRYHCKLNCLTKSEIAFFGEKRKIKKDYLKPLDRKAL